MRYMFFFWLPLVLDLKTKLRAWTHFLSWVLWDIPFIVANLTSIAAVSSMPLWTLSSISEPCYMTAKLSIWGLRILSSWPLIRELGLTSREVSSTLLLEWNEFGIEVAPMTVAGKSNRLSCFNLGVWLSLFSDSVLLLKFSKSWLTWMSFYLTPNSPNSLRSSNSTRLASFFYLSVKASYIFPPIGIFKPGEEGEKFPKEPPISSSISSD